MPANERLPLTLADGSGAELSLRAFSQAVRFEDGVWRFDIPRGQHAYLTSRDDTRFEAPTDRDPFALPLDRLARVSLDARLEGGAARVLLIEYDDRSRLGHAARTLAADPVDLVFRTQTRGRAACLAIRLSGAGALRLNGIRVSLLPEAAVLESQAAAAAPEPQAAPPAADAGEDRCVWVRVADRRVLEHAIAALRARGGLSLVVPADPPPLDGLGLLRDGCDSAQNIFPAARWAPIAVDTPDGLNFTLNQLESLWRAGLLWALATDLDRDPPLHPAALDWLAQRRVPLLCAARGSLAEHETVRAARARETLPVLVQEAAEAALDGAQAAQPGRLAEGPPLRDVLAIVADERRRTLSRAEPPRFPPLPQTQADLDRQGFVITRAAALTSEEADFAKEFWSEYEVKAWYKNPKPWALLVADVARAVGASSVLEFGCSVGRNLCALREALPGARLVGYDINPQAIQLGREASGLDLRLGDEKALAAHADCEFDFVFTVSVLDHVSEIASVCRELLRVARRAAFFLEVRLPVEGKVLRHFDHLRRDVRDSTGASYSWKLETYLTDCPRLEALDRRPCYLHSTSLGPYYWAYLAHLRAAP